MTNNNNNPDLLQQILTLIQSHQPLNSPTSSSSCQSASNIARSLREDSNLAENVGRVLGSSLSTSSNRPVMPSLHQPSSSGRYVPYGRRKKKEPRSYNMKLIIVDFIPEVNDFGRTERYDGSSLLECPFRVRETELDSTIRAGILNVVKSRYRSYNGTFFYASRQGRAVFNLSPCQVLDGKAVNTIKSKSTNNLYVMLSEPAPARPPPDSNNEDNERNYQESELVEDDDLGGSLLTFSTWTPRASVASRDRGLHFRKTYLPAVASECDLPKNLGEETSGHSTCDEDECLAKPFCGHCDVRLQRSLDYKGRGFYNPDGKSCGITASLTLLQYVGPFIDVVASSKGGLCEKLREIYQLRGLKDKSISKALDDLRALLGVPVDQDTDANEFIHKLLGEILKDENASQQIFCGKRKLKMALNLSASSEVLMQKFSDLDTGEDTDYGNCAVTSLGFPVMSNAGNSNIMSLRDLLSEKLREPENVPYNDWSSDWKDQYQENDELHCDKITVYECAPKVALLALQRGTAKPTLKMDNRPIQIPMSIPEADFTNPEDECIHSLDCTGESLQLFGMIVYSEVRHHQYAMIKVRDSTWIVHDDLNAYEVDLTTEFLTNLGGKDRNDSSVTFMYLKGSDLAVEKPPLPDKGKQKDILKRLGSSIDQRADGDCMVINDEKEVDYQRIYHKMEASTRSFVGLEPLKQQFLRFAKTAILNEKRKKLGFQVDDMSTQCLHFIFQGNPGTGKTTFARKVAELLYSVNKIKTRKVVEVQRGDLVGQFLGSTEDKTATKISEARGGVLFVDEAYRLTPRSSNMDYGRIAINQLMAAMEKGDPVMIFAGYPKEMKEFLKSNPGLDSRIKYKFTFPDYSVTELAKILENGIRDSGYRYSGQISLAEMLEKETTAAIRSQQNGRLAKNIVAEAIINLSSRLSFTDDGVKLVSLEAEDVIHACRLLCDQNDPTDGQITESEVKETED